MGEQFDKAASLNELCKAAKECKRGVAWKATPVEYYITRVTSCKRLKDEILGGTYKVHPGDKVYIYKPKKRIATAPWFKDRVWQRSMCNNGVYEDLTRDFIVDNIACQKDKGVDMAIRRVIEMLQTLHRAAPGKPVYGIHLDVRKFFPSTPHRAIKEMDARRIRDHEFIRYLNEIIDSSKDERSPEIIANDPFGERGTGLGSQINQLHQVALLDGIDHKAKSLCTCYIRYNDDFLVLSHDKEALKKTRELIRRDLEDLGLTMTDKAGLFRADQGFYFLRKRFIMTKTGKIIIRLHPRALAEERQVLRKLKNDLDAGLITLEYVQDHYQSWVANAEYAGDAPIRAMDKFFTQTFRVKPKYKRKKRYLYGQRNQALKGREAQKSRSREPDAQGTAGSGEGESRVHSLHELSGDS